MTTPGNDKPAIGSIVLTIILSSLALILPGYEWSLFGWMHVLLPFVAFFVVCKFGEQVGIKLLLAAATISLIGYILAGEIEPFFFSAIMFVAGYALNRSALRNHTPAFSGLIGCLVLASCWMVLIAVFSLGQESSIYDQLLSSLDQGFTEAIVYYRQSSSIPVDALVVLETALLQMKTIVPVILPGILGSIILFIIWLSMILGNTLKLKTTNLPVWPSYQFWQLPDKLIWGAIIMAILALIPLQPMRGVGINALILFIVVYCFQGLSITVFFMNKWNVPLLLRSFFYVMIVFQSLGTFILLFFGIADIWLDFRKLNGVANNKLT